MATGHRTGIALKALQWFIRAVQFGCSAVILAIFSYFLATLSNHNLHIATWIRAVEGISGAATLYTLIGLLLLCCVAGHPFFSFIAIILDLAFAGAFIYLAVANREGANSCRGHVNTAFGSGNADSGVRDSGSGGWTALPSLRDACRMQTACLAVAIAGILFFLFSALVEVALVRHRRKEKRFGPGPANDYTEGYGSKKRGLFGFGRKRRTDTGITDDANGLPTHTTPADVRDSYATEQTRVGTSHGANGGDVYNKYGESGYNGTAGVAPPAVPPPNTHTYDANAYTTQPTVGGYQHNATSGITGSGPGTSVQDTGVAEFPPGHYHYDDGTYSSRR